ncbi:MAG: sigma-54-dependent Fis family transcriptional regulator [Spirochaetales bacterium]|jgi:DNA-binding NtrC family response regulator|nr:sigma-54-dependent Fis family transcriptional regulator [Spirochaetales bacterium]
MTRKPFPTLPVIIVDDEEAILSSTTKVLRAEGIDNIITCQDPRDALKIISENSAETILLDLSMPHITGDELLVKIQERFPEIPVIIITASGEIDTAIRCIKNGAFDYMVKAVEPARLISGVRRSIDVRGLSRRYLNLRKNMLDNEVGNPEYFRSIITDSYKMKSIFRFIEAIAPTRETVLITGETGTGKELFAESIHNASDRAGGLVKVNTAGLDETMFTDTLFGHTKGAYTGADQIRKGLVQQADEGTLFLDEIGDLSSSCQIKLLRLLESREYYSLGSDVIRTTGARFVVATNRDLPSMVAADEFRRDLYYRLQTHEIRIPPLRDRKEDLPLLLDHFLKDAADSLSKKILTVPPELLVLLGTYDYPGNLRELRSMIFNAVSKQREKMLSIQPFREAMGHTGDLPRLSVEYSTMDFPDRLPTIKTLTQQLIEEALTRSKGNQAIAAGILGLTPQALSKRLLRLNRKDGAEE